MAKTKISEYDATAANNTDIDSINIAEGMAPSNVNNAIRELMAHLKDGLGAGTPVYLDDTNDRLGVGTTSPDTTLHIAGGANPTLQLTAYEGTQNCDVQILPVRAELTGSKSIMAFKTNNGTSLNEVMRIDEDGNVGIGTTSPSSKLHIDDADDAASGFRMNNTAGESVQFYYASSAADADFIVNRTGSGAADMGIDHEGNVYFTSGNVGIGTSSPDTTLVVEESAITQTAQGNDIAVFKRNADGYIKVYSPNTGLGGIAFGDTDDPFIGAIRYQHSTDHLDFYVNNAERMRIDSSGNVGIGTTVPHDDGVNFSTLTINGAKGGSIVFSDDDVNQHQIYTTDDASLRFARGSGLSSETMRIDSSGNVLVGSTNTAPASNNVDGVSLRVNNSSQFSRSNDPAFAVNRKGNDGGLATFMKDGTTVGSIGTSGGDLLIHTTTASHTGLRFGEGYIFPTDNTGATANGTVDLGISGASAFKDAYFSGTVNAGGATIDGTLSIHEVIETVGLTTGSTTTFTMDLNERAVLYFTNNQAENRTINFRGDGSTTLNSLMASGESMTAAILMTQGSTPYYLNAYQVDGSSVTPKWANDSAPTSGNASSIDSYTFTIIKTADATFTVLASVTQYKQKIKMTLWMPKKQILYAPMLATFGGGSISGFKGLGPKVITTGEHVYTNTGNHTFTVPENIDRLSILLVGAGGAGGGGGGGSGGGGGGGGALAYKNTFSTSAGTSYTVTVGVKGTGTNGSAPDGQASAFAPDAGYQIIANGGSGASRSGGTPFGSYTAGYTGGTGGTAFSSGPNKWGGGGGGAAGYSANGGNGGYYRSGGYDLPGTGTGGAASGGYGGFGLTGSPGGGGVGILIGRSSGTVTTGTYGVGKGNSGGTDGSPYSGSDGGDGGLYGGGGGGATGATNNGSSRVGGDGGNGAVRIIWWSDALGASSRTWPETRVTQSDSEVIYVNNVLQ